MRAWDWKAIGIALELVACAQLAGVERGKLSPDASRGGASFAGAGRGGVNAGGVDAVGGAGGAASGEVGGGGTTGGGGGTTGGTGGTTGGAGAGSCPSPEFCLRVPQGFSGPVAIIRSAGAEPASCTGFFGSQFATMNEGLTADPATCQCQCDATGVTCGSATTGLFSSGCGSTPCKSVSAAPSACFQLTGCGTYYETAATATGACTSSVKKTVPPIRWSKRDRICSVSSPTASCAGGKCVNPAGAPFAYATCVTALGDVSCPAGLPTKILGYATVADSRDCSTGTCNCYDPHCGWVEYFPSADCSGGGSVFTVPGFCVNNSNVGSIRYSPAPYCDTRGSVAPTGNVTPVEPRTVCCL